jgi:hypothetical protein
MLVGIVLLDLATKLMANYLLPFEEYVAIINDHFFFLFKLQFNPQQFSFRAVNAGHTK